MTKNEFVMNLCPLMTTVEHYNGLYEFMKDNKLIPSFLVNGNIELVRKVITYDDDVENALALSFRQEKHGRFIGILTAGEHQHIQSGAQGKWRFSMDFPFRISMMQ